MKPVRVLVVDDSAIVRKLISEALSSDPGIEVAGTAPDPIIARDKIRTLKPDVVTLDIEMPRMDGLSFLRELMDTEPLPVVIISSLAQRGCAAALKAMELGAVEVLAKPSGPYSVGELRTSLADKIRAAAQARLRSRLPKTYPPVAAPRPATGTRHSLVAIGASTGGTEAIRHVLEVLPANIPPVLIVQHIPPVFSAAFAARLNQAAPFEVKEAEDGDAVTPGRVLIAPGDRHMVLRRRPAGLSVQIMDGPRVCYQRPSVDVMFQSVAEASAARTIGVLLTGMGADGAAGLLRIKESGGVTIAQDESSCVVYGMPREAVRRGAASHVLPLSEIAGFICAAAHLA
jgi:two-component system chemotaxis response regulator CheB